MGKHLVAAAFLLSMLLLARPSLAVAEPDIGRFMGEYVGRSIQAPNEAISARDLSIKISAHGENGFTLEWTTIIHDVSGVRRQSYSIDFAPSDRAGIYSSAMHRDTFGHAEPLDPLKGEPYVWADITGPTLTVYALLIVDGGGYEIQTYRRTLTADGMALRFSRNRNGQELKTVTGLLQRKQG